MLIVDDHLIFELILQDDLKAIQEVIKENPQILISERSANNELPLTHACVWGHFESADELKKMGASVDGHFKQVLDWGIDKEASVNWLVKNGARILPDEEVCLKEHRANAERWKEIYGDMPYLDLMEKVLVEQNTPSKRRISGAKDAKPNARGRGGR